VELGSAIDFSACIVFVVGKSKGGTGGGVVCGLGFEGGVALVDQVVVHSDSCAGKTVAVLSGFKPPHVATSSNCRKKIIINKQLNIVFNDFKILL